MKKQASTAIAPRAKIALPANLDEELAKEAANIASRIGAPSGNRIRCTLKKTFKFPDGTESADPLRAVIVDFISGNFYYEKEYDPNDIVPPLCAALDSQPSMLAPFNDCTEKQAETCSVCPQNQFGTDRRGRGKACQNNRILALLPPDATEQTQFMVIHVSATAIPAFDSYVGGIARTFQTTPLQVVTTIVFEPSEEFPSLRFGNPEYLEKDNPLFALAISRRKEARDMLLTPPNFTRVEPVSVSKKGSSRAGTRRGA